MVVSQAGKQGRRGERQIEGLSPQDQSKALGTPKSTSWPHSHEPLRKPGVSAKFPCRVLGGPVTGATLGTSVAPAHKFCCIIGRVPHAGGRDRPCTSSACRVPHGGPVLTHPHLHLPPPSQPWGEVQGVVQGPCSRASSGARASLHMFMGLPEPWIPTS